MYINTYIQVVVSMVYLCVLHLLSLFFFKYCNLDQNFGYVKSSTSFRVISRWVNSDHGDTVPSVGNSEVHQSIVQKDCILPIDNFFFISSIIILISEIPQLNKKKISVRTLAINLLYGLFNLHYTPYDQISTIYFYSQ